MATTISQGIAGDTAERVVRFDLVNRQIRPRGRLVGIAQGGGRLACSGRAERGVLRGLIDGQSQFDLGAIAGLRG